MKLFYAALTAAPVTGDNSIVPIAIIAMAVVVVIAAVLLLTSRQKKINPAVFPPSAAAQAAFFSARPRFPAAGSLYRFIQMMGCIFTIVTKFLRMSAIYCLTHHKYGMLTLRRTGRTAEKMKNKSRRRTE